ncbi:MULTISPECIES: hypothetical protein [Serratia]|uniref:hypothetical protein n=1 Tax=Serratia TaxID=613 RepID=UPI00160433D0|nr:MULTISPECIES: hypothetical protein [Serratia]MBB1581591.1 hypothetical protein [Serratia sp. OS31]WBL74689.1 hypothetical protein LQ945_10520 [Serratia liquefaciens]
MLIDPLRVIFAKSTHDVKATGAMRLIFTKTYRHFATNGAIGFTFTRHPVKIGAITKKNESVHILAGKTRCCGFNLRNGGQSKIAELRLLTNEPG